MPKAPHPVIKQKLLNLIQNPKAIISPITDGYTLSIDNKTVFTCHQNAKEYSIIAGNNSVIASVSPNDPCFDEAKKDNIEITNTMASKLGIAPKLNWHSQSIMTYLNQFDINTR